MPTHDTPEAECDCDVCLHVWRPTTHYTPEAALDVERLARAMTEASPARSGIYAEAEAVAARYAALAGICPDCGDDRHDTYICSVGDCGCNRR